MLAIGNVCASIHFFSFFPRMHRTKQVFICDFHNMNLCVIHSTSNKSSTCSLHLLAHCFSSNILFHSTSSFCCCGCGCWLVKIVRQINRLRLISDMSRCEFFFVLRKFSNNIRLGTFSILSDTVKDSWTWKQAPIVYIFLLCRVNLFAVFLVYSDHEVNSGCF